MDMEVAARRSKRSRKRISTDAESRSKSETFNIKMSCANLLRLVLCTSITDKIVVFSYLVQLKK